MTGRDSAADAMAADGPHPAADASSDGASPEGAPYEPGYFRVITYGATGDGTHDDRPAIQAAMDAARAAGGTVYFDPGTYLLASSTSSDGQLFESNFGAGFTMNLLGNAATLTTSLVGSALLHAQGAWQNSYVRGLTFLNTHPVGTTTTVGIFLEGTNGNEIQAWTISQNTFRNFSRMITTTGVTGAVIDDNDFILDDGRDSGTSTNTEPNVGIWMFDNSPTDGTSVDVHITNNRYNGCGNLTTLSGTQSKSCGDGFVYGRAIGALVDSNSVRGFSAESIFLLYEPTAGAGSTVSNNTIDGTMIAGDMFGGGLWGVRADASSTVVEHNTIKNAVTGILSCSATFCGGTGTTATGLQFSDNTITTDASGTQVVYAGIQLLGVGSSSVVGNTITFASGAVPAEAFGIDLSGASTSSLSDALTVTGNVVTDTLSTQGSGVAGIGVEELSNWTITGNTVAGFSYGFDCLNQTGTMTQLSTLVSSNTLTGNAVDYRLQNGSF